MEKKEISITTYVIVFITAVLLLMSAGLTIAWLLPMGAEKLDAHFNPKQEIEEERFTKEYGGTLNVYHDNELNVTCWTSYTGTGLGLSCIPDADIRTSRKKHDTT